MPKRKKHCERSDPVEETKYSLINLSAWEVLLRYPEETFCYLNQEQTKEYAYPGGGTEDFTVYVTNVAG
ncbi:MAG: hypothetical protein ACI4WY_07865 [Anaerovoracaceae bacterium]